MTPTATSRSAAAPSGTLQQLDNLLRQWDRRTHLTRGGWLHRWLDVDRHTLAALLLPANVCALLVLASPSAARFGAAAVTLIVAGAALGWQMRRSARAGRPLWVDLRFQVGLVLLTAALIWLGAGGDGYDDDAPYRHVFIPLAVALAVALGAGAFVLGPLFRALHEQSRYGQYLKCTELFLSRDKEVPNTPLTGLIGFLCAPLRAPLAMLTAPAIITLLAWPVWLPLATIIAAAVSVAALWVGALYERFAAVWVGLQSALYRGGALLVSLAVIVLAALRLLKVDYVTTLLDSAAWWTIVAWLASAYVLSWWVHYWMHRLLTDQVLQLVDRAAGGKAAIAYEIAPQTVATSVPREARRLQIHGAARLVAINETGEKAPYFQAHTPLQLVTMLAQAGDPGGKAEPAPGQVAARMANYFVLMALTFAAIAGAATWYLHRGVQAPQVAIATDKGADDRLGRLLTPAGDPELIALAASGGGTRAAIYTAAVLEGLARQGKAAQVVLGSGVSGGGAALAYFAGHRPALATDAPDDTAWQRFFDTMSLPFIQEVLARASEWRMASSGRLGMLLAESFERHWGLGGTERRTLDAVSDMGLIFNTALAGHYARPDDAATTSLPLREVEPRHRERHTTSLLSGGRLLLANLDLPGSMVPPALEPDTSAGKLPVVLRSRELRLERAAALAANFPPVFSNAAIDVDDRLRYWVTDGGAVDNRGLEMLLLALRLELRKRPAQVLPRLHIIVADASALTAGYAQDRGLSTVTGAGARFASLLNAEVLDDLRRLYTAHPERLRLSYVMMPNLLRESGSFGTHWMLQPRVEARKDGERITLEGAEMVKVIRALHWAGMEGELTPQGCTVLKWARADPGHREGWNAVRGGAAEVAATKRCPR